MTVRTQQELLDAIDQPGSNINLGRSTIDRQVLIDIVDSMTSIAGGAPGHARFGFDNTVETVIVSANVPVVVSGPVTAQGTTQEFTINTTLSTITFDGVSPRLCNLSAVLALDALGGGFITDRMHINVNGSIVVSSNQQASVAKTTHEAEITLVLQPGDVVTLSVENLTGTDNIESDAFFFMEGAPGSVDPTRGFLVVVTI